MSAITVALFIITKWIVSLLVVLVAIVYALKLYFEPHNGKCRCKTNLKGKIALVTGGNSGIGLETARDLATRGAHVIIASRNVCRSIQAVDDIKRTSGNDQVEHRYLDLAKFSSVRAFAEEFNRDFNRLDILLNNSGCAGVKQTLTADGNDLVMQINHLGPFLLTNLLLDKLVASRPSRIVIVSSRAHEFSYFYPEDMKNNTVSDYFGPLKSLIAYANTKLCNVLWCRALAQRLPEGVTVNSLHPGVVKTGILSHYRNGCEYVVYTFLDIMINLFFKSTVEGSQTSIHLCVCPDLENVNGEYFAECKVEITKASSNMELADIVWNNSVKLTASDLGSANNT